MMQIPQAPNANGPKVTFDLLPVGMYPAYASRAIGLGTQTKTGYKGAPDSQCFKMNFGFEICGHTATDDEGNEVARMQFKNQVPIYPKADKGHAFDIGRAFNPSIANTQNFDWLALPGQACMIQVGTYTAKDGDEKNCVNAVLPPMAGMPMPDMLTECVTFNPYRDDDGSMLYDWEIKVMGEAHDADKMPINGTAPEPKREVTPEATPDVGDGGDAPFNGADNGNVVL